MDKNEDKPACKTCLEILELIVDNEATKEDEKFFMDHIDKCLPCFDHYELEKEIKELVRKKIARVPVPEDLALQIKSQILVIS